MTGFRFKLMPVFSDAIEPDAEMAALVEKLRAPFADGSGARASARPTRCSTAAAISTARFDDLICNAMLERARRRDRAVAGLPLGHEPAAGRAITWEDITNATAITYPNVYRNQMTGAQLKEILEDVADNIFHPDPYFQGGGDMVRIGGMGYTIDVGKPMGTRISDLTHLKSGKPIEASSEIHRRGLGQHQRGHARSADLGCGRAHSRGEARPCGSSRTRR